MKNPLHCEVSARMDGAEQPRRNPQRNNGLENCGEGIAEAKLWECEFEKSWIHNPQPTICKIAKKGLRKFEYENW